jgi:hypothetical protein
VIVISFAGDLQPPLSKWFGDDTCSNLVLVSRFWFLVGILNAGPETRNQKLETDDVTQKPSFSTREIKADVWDRGGGAD